MLMYATSMQKKQKKQKPKTKESKLELIQQFLNLIKLNKRISHRQIDRQTY